MKSTDQGLRLSKEHLFSILMIGATWGIFEATVGYALHLLPISVGFLVWYPVAVFFLMSSCRVTGKSTAILFTAALAAAIKLLNLFLPVRVDKVMNPAVSILLEGMAVFAASYAFEKLRQRKGRGLLLLLSLGMNTLWRAMYLAYLAFLVPGWIRDVSVLKSSEALIRFLVIDNGCSSLVVFLGMLAAKGLSAHGATMEGWFSLFLPKAKGLVPALLVGLLLGLNIILQMLL